MIVFKEAVFSNGLRLVMSRKSEIPNVIINSCFHVGSKDEEPDKTGISHLLEHLMFSGSENIPGGKFDEILHANGGESNAFTSQDYTSYYLSIPSSRLELGMWLDSDRYAKFPVTDEGLEVQKKVVIEEKLQTHDNSPFGSLEYESAKRLFKTSGYRWEIIGDEMHIKNFTLKDVENYYNRFYNPANMVLTVVGDIDYDETYNLAERYYGSIKTSGSKPERTYSEDIIENEIEDEIEDNITLPARFIMYRTPALGTNEFYAFRLMCVGLSSGESSNVYRSLVRTDLTTESYLSNQGMEFDSIFSFNSFLNKGVRMSHVSNTMDDIISNLKQNGLTDFEIKKSVNKVLTSYYLKIQQSMNLSNHLAFYKLFFNDCEMINKEIKIFENISNHDIKKYAEEYLDKNKRVVLNYVPGKKVKP
ncbi:MAG: pitrilysin family protein [Candidatus Kapaibacterium sp.]